MTVVGCAILGSAVASVERPSASSQAPSSRSQSTDRWWCRQKCLMNNTQRKDAIFGDGLKSISQSCLQTAVEQYMVSVRVYTLNKVCTRKVHTNSVQMYTLSVYLIYRLHVCIHFVTTHNFVFKKRTH